MNKVLALLLIPLLAAACVRVNTEGESLVEPEPRTDGAFIHISKGSACMKMAGVEESDLRAGVKVAEKEMFFDFTEGRILSLDY